MASPSSSRRSPLPRSPLFTSIPELKAGKESSDRRGREARAQVTAVRPEETASCRSLNKCRPSSRDPTSSPPAAARSAATATCPALKAPPLTSSTHPHPQEPRPAPPPRHRRCPHSQWRLEAQELSRKLLESSRQRDEALLEASALRRSVSELERQARPLGVLRLRRQVLPRPRPVGPHKDRAGSARTVPVVSHRGPDSCPNTRSSPLAPNQTGPGRSK
ncbi:uncharacterized protein A4U43_C10F1270 [Asparagus officinalis]|uniref:Uncharacterized protein n=1 Tax=Asparagus officinalis TaxID=4686 RepID=A0A5P1E458_ASPOF|nr:uncharacterized protein A4U43_C10F1270 [Asparagus officinalis]